MTLSMRPSGLVALFAAVLAVSAHLASAPSSVDQQTAVEQREVLPHPATPQAASEAQDASTPFPTADARTLLKYRYLIESIATNDTGSTELAALLQAREEAARDGADSSDADSAVLTRLDPARHAMYLALRDSDAEQRTLGDFASGLALQVPLDPVQRRELLFARLRHKQQYGLMLEQSGIDRTGLSDEDRNYAHDLLTQALHDYRDAYLDEMRAQLSSEQFRLLSDFEHTEFELALQRLQQSINER